jgi:hypothetical protein
MGGGSPQVTKSEQTLPAWLEKPTRENIAIADAIAKRPFEQYGGQTVAGLSPDQLAAYKYTRQNVGAYQPAYGAALGTTASVAGYQPGTFTGGDIGAYMNPYLENVEANALGGLEAQRLKAQQGIAQSARTAGAFGGSRQGISEAMSNVETARQAGDLSAKIRSQGYDTAAGLMQSDMDRALQGQQLRLQAGGQMSDIAGAGQRALYADAAALENIGKSQQAQQQARLNDAYQRWSAERNYPIDMLNLRIGATSAVPGVGTTTQSTSGGGNSWLSFLGGLGSAGSGLASLLPLFSASDEGMKTDITKMGKDKETGLDLYAYRYKGDPKSYPKVVGPMAQDIEKKFPDQVKDVGGRKAVNLGFGPMRRAFAA